MDPGNSFEHWIDMDLLVTQQAGRKKVNTSLLSYLSFYLKEGNIQKSEALIK